MMLWRAAGLQTFVGGGEIHRVQPAGGCEAFHAPRLAAFVQNGSEPKLLFNSAWVLGLPPTEVSKPSPVL